MCRTPRLAIIGAGPAGLSTARVFLANASNFKIQMFEKDYTPGGLWHYPDSDRRNRVMYDKLETNISKHLMKFSGFPFSSKVPHFPWRQDVYGYLTDYYRTLIENQRNIAVHLNTTVVSLSKVDGLWKIVSKNNATGSEHSQEFDHVVVANGHYGKSYVPNVPGLDAWFENDAAIHSKNFVNGEIARGKNVVVIGKGSSGSDIVNQVWTVASKVYQSASDAGEHELATVVPRIVSTDYANRSVELADGRKLENIDLLIYATGYLFSFPFMEASLCKDILGTTHTYAKRLHNLWQQIFFVKDPSLAFSLLPGMIIPFPLGELQAALMVKVFTGKVKVPSQPDDVLYADEISKRRDYHQISDFKDVDYYRELQAILDKAGGQNDPFKPVHWDDDYKVMRENGPGDKALRQKVLETHLKKLKSQGKPYDLLERSSQP
ncbi:FMO1 (YHR176W) [Zygosaccharomyces parabailii]|nr:FMO1 (YHR176W) [Zygosaccharomyces parabailii]